MRRNLLVVIGTLVVGGSLASADLIDAFAGYDTVWGVGVSGMQSSYYADTNAGVPVNGAHTGNALPGFGPDRVSYPSGIGPVPSPGGSIGAHFDQGAIGVSVESGVLSVLLATALDPEAGYYHNGFDTWYGQGDVFLTVQDEDGIDHFALLNVWAKDDAGGPLDINRDHYAAAEFFHLVGPTVGTNLEGHLVELTQDSDVALSGGRGAYNAGNAPDGLDRRIFAQGGLDRGDAGLVNSVVTDGANAWYLQSWSVPLSDLSSDASFEIALHAAASCGNDQIGGRYDVPEPGSILLIAAGFAWLLHCRRQV